MKWWMIAAAAVALWLLIRKKMGIGASRTGTAVEPQLPTDVEARAIYDGATTRFRAPAPTQPVAVDASAILGPVTPSDGGGFYPSLTDGTPPDAAVTTLPTEPIVWPWNDVSPDVPNIAPVLNVAKADTPIPIHVEGGAYASFNPTDPTNDAAINSTYGPATTDEQAGGSWAFL